MDSTRWHPCRRKARREGVHGGARAELEKEGAPVSVTLIEPAAIDTPFFEHAKSTMEGNPRPPRPVYAPEIVARAILDCAERPVRDLIVGGSGRAMVGMARKFPWLSDRLFRSVVYVEQQPDRREEGSLYEPSEPYGKERVAHAGRVRERSAYTYASLHPVMAAAALGLTAALAGAVVAVARR